MNKRQRLLSDLKTGKKYPECHNCEFWIEQPYQIISPHSRKDSGGGFCPRCERQKLVTRYCGDLYVDNCLGCGYVQAWKIPVAGYELDLGFLPRVEFGRHQCLWKNREIERALDKEPYILVSKRSNLWVRGWKMEDEGRKYTCHRNQLQAWLDGLEASREVITDWNKIILWEHLEWQSDELRAEEHQTDGGLVPLLLDSKTEGEDSQRPPSCVNPDKWNEAVRREEKLINTFCVDSYHLDSDFCSSVLPETVPFREGYTRFTDSYFWRRPSYTFVSRYRGESRLKPKSEEANYKDSRIRGSAWKSDSKFFILSQRSDTYWARKKPFLHPPTYDLPFKLDKQRKPIIVESPIQARNPRNVTPCKHPMNAPGNPNCRVGKGWDGATAKREMKWVAVNGLCPQRSWGWYGVSSKKCQKLGRTWKTRIVKNEWGYDEKQYYQGYDRKLARNERGIICRQRNAAVYQPRQDKWLCSKCGWHHRPDTACLRSAWERHPGFEGRGFIAPGGACQPPQPHKDFSLSRHERLEPVINVPRGRWLCVCGWYHKIGQPCPSSSFERYWHRRYPSVPLIKIINGLFPY